ncbi:transposase [Micromonospora sp. NPDC005171]|uniref:transposase n=1 Tax=Micromonospora sp. NPDC005171 TaxID=3156866 RepID=UPI0033BD0510
MAVGKRLAAARGAWICFQDEAGQVLRPPVAKTWARRGRTPVVEISGKGSGRVSIAGLVCLKPGERGRLMWRTRLHRGRKGERGSFGEDDYIAFLDQAHQRLQAPIVLIWDNLNTHVSRRMHALIAARAWLTVIRLPAYAPDLNPTEGVWRWIKRGLTNPAARGVDHLAELVKRRLRACQQQTDLLAGFFASTGMTLDPEPA